MSLCHKMLGRKCLYDQCPLTAFKTLILLIKDTERVKKKEFT